MPLWLGTGIPYGKSAFAFSGGTLEARCTMTEGLTFSSLARSTGCPSGVGEAPTTFDRGEVGRRETRVVVFFFG